MADSWSDPLHTLAPITDHPSRKSSTGSDALSSVPFRDLHAQGLERLNKYIPVSDHETKELLRIFLQKLPEGGQATLLNDIREGDDERLRDLRNHLVDGILKPMRVAGEVKLPTPPIFPLIDWNDETQIEPPLRDQKLLKAKCLQRDGFRCVFGHSYDVASREVGRVSPPVDALGTFTECAHILPFPLGSFDEDSAIDTKNKATIWWALHRYFPDLKGHIDASNVNQPENAITLDMQAHTIFRTYWMGFWPTDEPNKYRVHYFMTEKVGGLQAYSQDGIIELESKDPSVPLPRKEYFQVHYRIAEILSISGLGKKYST